MYTNIVLVKKPGGPVQPQSQYIGVYDIIGGLTGIRMERFYWSVTDSLFHFFKARMKKYTAN